MTSDRVLVTVTGPDRTGVTSTLTGILSQQGAALQDIEQVVVQGMESLRPGAAVLASPVPPPVAKG